MSDYNTITEVFDYIKRSYDRPNLLNYRADNAWKAISTREFGEAVECLALGLLGLGAQRGDRIGISAPSSPFWIISDLAITLAGCVTVPVFNRISPENLEFEIEDSRLTIFIVGDER